MAKKVLILGGTGAIGEALRRVLVDNGNKVYITSRNTHISKDENTTYIQGDALDKSFLDGIFDKDYDAIIDCMIYSPDVFSKRIDFLLSGSKQYFFISSSRVFAESNESITENSPRLIDVVKDNRFIESREYAILKAMEENLLFDYKNRNWTIIRPYITFSPYRLQLGVFEKENWLLRTLNGRDIVFPKALIEKKTTMTFCDDVAFAISCMIGNDDALGQAFNVTTSESHTWGEILTQYVKTIKNNIGIVPNIVLADEKSRLSGILNNSYQYVYDRVYDRVFTNEKIHKIMDIKFSSTLECLDKCLKNFIENPSFLPNTSWHLQAEMDKLVGKRTPLCEISGNKNKLSYLRYRLFNI